jgi:hypothetical protein
MHIAYAAWKHIFDTMLCDSLSCKVAPLQPMPRRVTCSWKECLLRFFARKCLSPFMYAPAHCMLYICSSFAEVYRGILKEILAARLQIVLGADVKCTSSSISRPPSSSLAGLSALSPYPAPFSFRNLQNAAPRSLLVVAPTIDEKARSMPYWEGSIAALTCTPYHTPRIVRHELQGHLCRW